MDDSETNGLARPQISTTPTATESVPTPIPPGGSSSYIPNICATKAR
ncbi:26174_t:CDS:2, partial [Racocetra persica]